MDQIELNKQVESFIRKEHSKKQALFIVDWVGNDKARLNALMQCYFSKEIRLCQRASWSLIHIAHRNPFILKPYLVQMVKNLDDPVHDAVIRNTIRIFEDCDVPEEIEGHLLEKCFEYINNPKLATAIRSFSITVAYNIIEKYPDLKIELISSLEDHMEHGLPSFKNRAKKTLKKLRGL